MARHTWHKALNRMRDSNFLLLSLEARAVLAGLEDLMADDGTVDGNLSTLALYLGVDQKKYRLKTHIDTLISEGYIIGTSEDRGKKGLWYTLELPDDHPAKSEKDPRKAGERSEKGPRKVRETGVDKSAKNAGSGDASLTEKEILSTKGEQIRSPLPPAADDGGEERGEITPLSRVVGAWLALRGKGLSPTQFDLVKIREALALPGATLPLVLEVIATEKARRDRALSEGRTPERIRTAALLFTLVEDRLQRDGLMTAPIPVTPGAVAPQGQPRKPAETDPERLALIDQVVRQWVNAGRHPSFGAARLEAETLTTDQLRQESARGSAA